MNPPAAVLATGNAIVTGRARHYAIESFAGPLSLKSVVEGSAVWETAAGRFEVHPRSALVVHEGEEYSMVIDALRPVETFCLFFERGYVEDACRAFSSGSDTLLDAGSRPVPVHLERRHYGGLADAMERAHRFFQNGMLVEPIFASIASMLAGGGARIAERAARLPAVRASTREELRRRVALATDYIHANLGASLRLADIASAAMLSPFHLHRLFLAIHGVTPHRYVNALRLEHARVLLESTGRSILDVALDCGFESVTSFTTLFRRAFGVPPGRFRKIREADL